MSADASTESVQWLVTRLRRARRRYYTVEYSAFMALALAVLVLGLSIYGLADVLVHFPFVARLVISLVLLVTGLYVVRRALERFIRELDDEEMVARFVESKAEDGDESLRSILISSFQFGTRDCPGSVALQNATIRRARDLGIDPLSIRLHDPVHVRKATRFMAVAVIVAGLGGGFFPQHSLIALKRIAGMNVSYPTRTQITKVAYRGDQQDQTNPEAVPLGTKVVFEITARGELPASGQIRIEPDGEKDYSLALMQDEEEPGTYYAELSQALKDLEFQVRLGDAPRENGAIRVVIPPAVTQGSIHVASPAYTKARSKTSDLTDLTVLEGSTLTFTIQTDREVERAQLLLNADRTIPLKRYGPKWRGVLDRVEETTAFTFRIIDAHGIANINPVTRTINVEPDHAPEVKIVTPGALVHRTTFGRVQFKIEAKDDYAISNLQLSYRVLRPSLAADDLSEKELRTGKIPLPFAKNTNPVTAEILLPVSKFKALAGDRVEITAVATDIAPTPNTAGSEPISLNVVTVEELRAIYAREQSRIITLVGKLRDEEERQSEAIKKRLENKK